MEDVSCCRLMEDRIRVKREYSHVFSAEDYWHMLTAEHQNKYTKGFI